MNNIILVIIGGGAGALARYASIKALGLSKLTYSFSNVSLNIMFVNILGSFLFGLFLYLSKIFHLSDSIKLLLMTGFISSFTTYSTFIYEFYDLIENKNLLYAGSYLALSIIIPVFIMLLFLSKT